MSVTFPMIQQNQTMYTCYIYIHTCNIWNIQLEKYLLFILSSNLAKCIVFLFSKSGNPTPWSLDIRTYACFHPAILVSRYVSLKITPLRLTDLENELMVAGGKEIVRNFGKVMYTLLYLKWITNKDLLYSTWNFAQCYVPAWMGGGCGGEWIYVYVWLSPFAVHLKLQIVC